MFLSSPKDCLITLSCNCFLKLYMIIENKLICLFAGCDNLSFARSIYCLLCHLQKLNPRMQGILLAFGVHNQKFMVTRWVGYIVPYDVDNHISLRCEEVQGHSKTEIQKSTHNEAQSAKKQKVQEAIPNCTKTDFKLCWKWLMSYYISNSAKNKACRRKQKQWISSDVENKFGQIYSSEFLPRLP